MPDTPNPPSTLTTDEAFTIVAELADYSADHRHDWVINQSGLLVGSLLAIAVLTPEVNDRPQWYANETVQKLGFSIGDHMTHCGGC